MTPSCGPCKQRSWTFKTGAGETKFISLAYQNVKKALISKLSLRVYSRAYLPELFTSARVPESAEDRPSSCSNLWAARSSHCVLPPT
ncbi:hypothetical protein NDU88_002017 [Pleurodeles waltl]|uniref:Uncharacterized protein n=1 Tax=Pleurodeles waltl TaxID=8319 RepID=A0AAV7R8W8_PLEWA|nr:hypothetical protein NDU88_002017 [Pleurodeles waltl]